MALAYNFSYGVYMIMYCLIYKSVALSFIPNLRAWCKMMVLIKSMKQERDQAYVLDN